MTDSTPIDRLRALHEPILCPDCGSDEHCGYCGNETWPCDTIAALDALEARLDAATALIWGAQMDEHMIHGASLKRAALRACEHPSCAPYRAWLAGDKEEHSDRG